MYSRVKIVTVILNCRFYRRTASTQLQKESGDNTAKTEGKSMCMFHMNQGESTDAITQKDVVESTSMVGTIDAMNLRKMTR